jgi:hypothetical protein
MKVREVGIELDASVIAVAQHRDRCARLGGGAALVLEWLCTATRVPTESRMTLVAAALDAPPSA